MQNRMISTSRGQSAKLLLSAAPADIEPASSFAAIAEDSGCVGGCLKIWDARRFAASKR